MIIFRNIIQRFRGSEPKARKRKEEKYKSESKGKRKKRRKKGQTKDLICTSLS